LYQIEKYHSTGKHISEMKIL